MPWPILIALSAAGTAFFLAVWFQSRREYSSLSRTAQREADYEAEQTSRRSLGFRGSVRLWLLKRGYRGDLTPAFMAFTMLYLICAIGLRIGGIEGLLGVALALPAAGLASLLGFNIVAQRRRRTFARQLSEMLVLLASQIESGVGSARALNTVVPNVGNPLREEMSSVLAAVAANKDLVTGMKELAERYPSRAISMFISALEIDRDQGGAIAPALRQAAALLQRDFDLAEEAQAELSQAKSEFFGIIVIISGITLMMFNQGGSEQRDAYLSAMGIVGLAVGGANFALGIYRAMRAFNAAKGDM